MTHTPPPDAGSRPSLSGQRITPPSLPPRGIKRLLLGSAIATTAALGIGWVQPQPAAAFRNSPKAVLDEAWQIVNREYVDSTFNNVDWQAVRHSLLSQDYTSNEQAYGALRQSLRQLNDPYTRFLNPREYSDLTDQTSGQVSGIGIRIRRDVNSGDVIIAEVLENSPAARAGVQQGDLLLMVDGQSTARLGVDAISGLIRGDVDSQVTLTLKRNNNAQRTLIVTRERIEVPTVQHNLRRHGDARIGYIRLAEFNAQAADQMEKAIESLKNQGVEAFVLDLRGNPGGLLQSSIDITRMWLQRGPIVRTVDRSGISDNIRARGNALTDLPLAVLVDNQSASSSEIVTGALMDNNRATVVGSPTFGKALVQSLYGLSDGSGLAVTVAHYFTPNGTDISSNGITPNIQIDISASQRRELLSNPNLLATEADPQFLRAVTALEPNILANRGSATPTPGTAAPAGASQLGQR